ncbi:hypothetical protein COY95_02000 [Candidatus Woesearchaeota archaeon CG_4_10_14_0_8_um_filter_47_5]|nr:MAG: hypothetical protein COY95_02000 [Candidatus Woesearchaeota archaeon CG_4_10_14_0_8_um_filter_47_5]
MSGGGHGGGGHGGGGEKPHIWSDEKDPHEDKEMYKLTIARRKEEVAKDEAALLQMDSQALTTIAGYMGRDKVDYKELHQKLDEIYSVSNTAHRFHDKIKDLDSLSDYDNAILRDIYGDHLSQIKKTVGDATPEDLIAADALIREHQSQHRQRLARHAVSDIDVNVHGNHLAKYVADKAELKKYNLERLARDADNLMMAYFNNRGAINESIVRNVVPEYKLGADYPPTTEGGHH